MSAPAFVNFAYGSNMCLARLRERTPTAQPLGIGLLRGWHLAWHKVGRDGSAKCDIAATGNAADEVWGVLYRIAAHERALLDAAEGLGSGYDLHELGIESGGRTVRAFAYVATHTAAGLQPFDWYHAFVVQGAREHGLPAQYLRELESVQTLADSDAPRREAGLALLRRGAGGGA